MAKESFEEWNKRKRLEQEENERIMREANGLNVEKNKPKVVKKKSKKKIKQIKPKKVNGLVQGAAQHIWERKKALDDIWNKLK